jgi:pimeloyl-ACP methyl ester carboxylesterase
MVLPLLLALASPVAGQAAPPVPVVQQPVAQTDHISVTAVGRGTPVILIPGLASPRAVYDGVVPALARKHRVYLVQVNGFGGDDPRANTQPGVLDGIVADVVQLIEREKMVRPAVVGHSMGGLAGMMLAARHPDRVGRLMVVDALPFIGTILAPGATAESIKPQAAAIRDATAARPAPAPVTSDPGGIWSITSAGRIQVANWGAKANPRAVAEALYEDMVTDVTPQLGRITAPMTVLYATGAGPMATAIWERAYKGSPAKLEPVAGSYHFIMLDQPAAFQAALDRFLAAK